MIKEFVYFIFSVPTAAEVDKVEQRPGKKSELTESS